MRPALYDLTNLLFKRKRLIGLAFLFILGPAVIIALSRPVVYRARGRLMVQHARAYPQLTPVGEERRIPTVPENDVRLMAATVQSLRSRSFLREVGNLLATRETANGNGSATSDGSGNGHGDQNARWWTRKIAKGLEVTAHTSAPLIEVGYRSPQPGNAARIVNTVLTHYIGYQARAMFDNPALRTFYEGRQRVLEDDLIRAESLLAEFQERHGIFSVETQRAALARSHSEAIQALATNSAQIRQAEAEAQALASHLQKLPAQVTLHTYGDSPRLAALKSNVVGLELELNDLRQLYTEEDQRVKNILQRLSRAEEMLIMAETTTGQMPISTRLESNDAYQNILENALRQEAAAEALRARRQELEASAKFASTRLEDFNRLSYEYERRRAERDAKQVSFQKFLTLAEQARSSEAMDREGLTNVRITDRAPVPSNPVPTRGWLTLALALVASITVGIGGAFGVESLSGTIHSQREGEEQLALPVFAVIPEDQ